MRYRTPAALEMAVKAAAKASPLDTNLAISGFYFHRLLCRVFSEKDRKFVQKEPAPSPSSGRGPEEWQWPGRRSWRASTLQTKWTRPRIGAGIRS